MTMVFSSYRLAELFLKKANDNKHTRKNSDCLVCRQSHVLHPMNLKSTGYIGLRVRPIRMISQSYTQSLQRVLVSSSLTPSTTTPPKSTEVVVAVGQSQERVNQSQVCL